MSDQCDKCKCSVENRGLDCVVKYKGRWLCYPCVVDDLDNENKQLRHELTEAKTTITKLYEYL